MTSVLYSWRFSFLLCKWEDWSPLCSDPKQSKHWCAKAWSSLVHPTTWKCSQFGRKQHRLPGRSSGSLVLATGTAAWWCCLGFMALLWGCARQRCFGMGVSSLATCLMGRRLALDCSYWWPGSLKERTGIFYWVAFTNHRVSIADFYLGQACVGALCVTLAKTRNRDGQVLSKTNSFTCLTGT